VVSNLALSNLLTGDRRPKTDEKFSVLGLCTVKKIYFSSKINMGLLRFEAIGSCRLALR
jgi:hypothetical protein